MFHQATRLFRFASLLLFVIAACTKSKPVGNGVPPPGSDQFITWNIAGEKGYVATPADSLYAYAANGSSLLYASASAARGVYSYFYARFNAEDTGSFALNALDITTNGRAYEATSPATVNINQFGNTGDYITGSYSGEMKFAPAGLPVKVTGEFRLRRL